MTKSGEDAVRILAREFVSVGLAVGRSTVEVTGNGDSGHRDRRHCRQLLLERFAVGQAKSPSVVVDDDVDVIGVGER